MNNSCGSRDQVTPASAQGEPAAGCCGGSGSAAATGSTPLARFERMIPNCLEYAKAAKQAGRPIVGMMCEFTPRELILAAGGVPVCLCGGSAATIAAAETQLPANLCPLIKSTFGYHVAGSNPFLEMADLVVGETTCDGKKKMYELMGLSRPMYVLELPQQADDADALAHWLAELRKFRTFLEHQFHTTIADAQLWDAIAVMNEERQLRRELATLMAADRPPLTGTELLRFKSSISGIACDLAAYRRAREWYGAQQTAATACDAPPSQVRVLLTGVPIAHGAERVLNIVEEQGGLVVAMENCTGLKPLIEDVDTSHQDPLTALAEKYIHLGCSVMTPNHRRLELLRELADTYRPQCVIDLIWQACLTYDVESHQIKQLAENELKIPYLRIETDYSPSDSARIGVRVEALFETIRNA